MSRLVLNFQFWEGDKEQAMKLARLVADLQKEKRDDVYVMFSARFDCSHDNDTIAYVEKKFPVIKYTSTYRGTGWPIGPNWLMANSYQHFVELNRNGSIDAEVCHLIEADCVPLSNDWIDRLKAEWDSCGKMVLGAYIVGADGRNRHINGNCLIHRDFWRKYKAIFTPTKIAWDADMASAIIPNAANSKLIWSDYQLGMPHNPWRGVDYLFEPKIHTLPFHPQYGEEIKPVWFHGIKYKGAIEEVYKKLLT